MLQLPADRRYLLISDLHLGDGGRTDLFGSKDHDFERMLRATGDHVDGVILGGDVLDATQADSADSIRRAHPLVIQRLDELARSVPVYHLVGNHDAPGYIERLLPSVVLCQAVHLGQEVRVVHGHQLDVYFHDGPLNGKGSLSLRAHAIFERVTGQFIRLPFAFHDNRTNRFAHWVFYRLTMAVLLLARIEASIGDDRRIRGWAAHHDFWARSQWGDGSALLLPALRALADGEHRILVTGHNHQAGVLDRIDASPTERVSGEPQVQWRTEERRAPAARDLERRIYVNLGSWTLDQSTYGLWDGAQIEVHDWLQGRPVDDRSYRIALTRREIPGMREWWDRYYRGLGRYETGRILEDLAEICPPGSRLW